VVWQVVSKRFAMCGGLEESPVSTHRIHINIYIYIYIYLYIYIYDDDFCTSYIHNIIEHIYGGFSFVSL